MKHIKPFFKLVIIGALTFLLISLIVPYCLQKIYDSRQEALNTIAFNVEQELEEALNRLNIVEDTDFWLLKNSDKLYLEPWGVTEHKKNQYRFLSNITNKDCTELKTYNIKYLRENFVVIYEGNGNFRVKIFKE
ncbi:hypothetical protein IMX26_11665 [Clostridium sp. 'deep sea']|uniref:hypothetical protein n=1 Tax=Clostridium sp. 'deep sea' TaxID=2779445 RepID=UPI0018967242|nr:hypothetical protein [Clostridium sp. 'deep sea']QOR34147.1 hypothetical protein IMX26_11665 [Clostridium sp. 'deep sea']